MVTDFLFGFRALTFSYVDLTLSHCNIDLLFVNLVNLVNLTMNDRYRWQLNIYSNKVSQMGQQASSE